MGGEQEKIETTGDLGKQEKRCYSVGIYARLSVDNDFLKAESIENQIEIARQFIAERNAKINEAIKFVVYETYVDRGVSGTSFNRSGFAKLMKDVRKRRVNCIIVKDLSRLGRDYLQTGIFIEKTLPSLGCRFISVADGIDSMDEDLNDAKLVMNIKNIVNEMYVRDISKRVAASKKMLAHMGYYVGGFAPYGYDVVNDCGMRVLEINEECAKVVRLIFDLRSKGTSTKNIAAYLYDGKVHTISDYKKYGRIYAKEGETLRQWSESTIARIIGNENYVGIVSEEVFKKANEKGAAVNLKIKTEGGQEKEPDIYRGILYCGCCKKVMHNSYYRSRVKDESRYSYYCRNAYLIDDRKCMKNYIRQERVTQAIFEKLREALINAGIKEEDLTSINMKECDDKISGYVNEKLKISIKCGRMKKKAGDMHRKYKEGMITIEEYDVFRMNRKQKYAYAMKSIEEINKKIERTRNSAEEENRFLRSLLSDEKEKKLNVYAVDSLIDKVYIFPEGVIEIMFKFSKPFSNQQKSAAAQLIFAVAKRNMNGCDGGRDLE